ncbi:hypothetical protein BJ170DRAFT_590949 [Xylariales sp. AK1849]|nr:hypothetical protein BJ170DRAFT_590949 [Xylariales sp. AK1849]
MTGCICKLRLLENRLLLSLTTISPAYFFTYYRVTKRPTANTTDGAAGQAARREFIEALDARVHCNGRRVGNIMANLLKSNPTPEMAFFAYEYLDGRDRPAPNVRRVSEKGTGVWGEELEAGDLLVVERIKRPCGRRQVGSTSSLQEPMILAANWRLDRAEDEGGIDQIEMTEFWRTLSETPKNFRRAMSNSPYAGAISSRTIR